MTIPSGKNLQRIKKWLGPGSIDVFGLPFSGKDTQCHNLAAVLDGVMISGGDILRRGQTPAHIIERINSGKLAPTEEYLGLVLPYLKQARFKNKPLVLSSVGRWSGEEQAVLKACEESGHELKLVIYLDIPHSEVRKRWETAQKAGDRGARHDDARHILQTRFEEFHNKTKPVVKFYESHGLLEKIDGTLPKNKVFAAILNALSKRAFNA